VGQSRSNKSGGAGTNDEDEPALQVQRSKPQPSGSEYSDEPSLSTRILSARRGAEAVRVSSGSRSHSEDDGEATVRLSGRFVMRDSIPEDDSPINMSGDAIDGGNASTSVLAAMEVRYAPVQTDSFGGEIELLPLQIGSAASLTDLVASGVSPSDQ
jgi:hypothetical protein